MKKDYYAAYAIDSALFLKYYELNAPRSVVRRAIIAGGEKELTTEIANITDFSTDSNPTSEDYRIGIGKLDNDISIGFSYLNTAIRHPVIANIDLERFQKLFDMASQPIIYHLYWYRMQGRVLSASWKVVIFKHPTHIKNIGIAIRDRGFEMPYEEKPFFVLDNIDSQAERYKCFNIINNFKEVKETPQ